MAVDFAADRVDVCRTWGWRAVQLCDSTSITRVTKSYLLALGTTIVHHPHKSPYLHSIDSSWRHCTAIARRKICRYRLYTSTCVPCSFLIRATHAFLDNLLRLSVELCWRFYVEHQRKSVRTFFFEDIFCVMFLYSSGPLVRNSNLGLVLIPYRASQFQYNFL